MYGGRDICPRCSKAVYAAELVDAYTRVVDAFRLTDGDLHR